jgi:hypothetical protein
MPSIKHLL